MALKDILGNRGQYADDMVVTLADGTTATLGEMRSLDAEGQAALTQRHNTLAQAEQVFADRVKAALDSGAFNPDLTPRIPSATDAQMRNQAASQFNLREDDPLLGQVVREMKRLQSDADNRFKALQEESAKQIKELTGVVRTAIGTNLNDHYSAKYAAESSNLPEEIRAKAPKYEDVLKFAEQNRMMDQAGRYDIQAAMDRMTWDQRKEYERKQITQEAAAAAEKAAQMARMKPSSGIRTESPAEQKGQFNPTMQDGNRTRTKTLDEVLAEAAGDDKLWQSALTYTGGSVH